MIRTPRTHLKGIYGQLGPCDAVDFGKNIKMSTDANYQFSERQEFANKISKEMNAFHRQIDHIQNYADKMNTSVNVGKIHFKFKKDDFAFGSAMKGMDGENPNQSMAMFDSSALKKRQQKKTTLLNMDLKFDFQKISMNIRRKTQDLIMKVQQKPGMGIREINMINESQQFKENFKEFDDYFEILRDLQNYQQKSSDPNNVKLLKGIMDYLNKQMNTRFRIRQPHKGIATTMRGQQYNFKFLRDFKPYKVPNQIVLFPTQIQKEETIIEKECLFDFAGRGYTPKQYRQYLQKYKQVRKQQMLLQKQNQLELELDEIKIKIRMLKSKLKDKKGNKVACQQTQTQKIITNQYVKDLISLEDQVLIDKINKLLVIKQEQIQKGTIPQKVYKQVHPIMNNLCFQLLMLIASGEKFINWADYMLMDDRTFIEKTILSTIYENINNLNLNINQSGNSKIKLLKLYSTLKMMIEQEGGSLFQINRNNAPIKQRKKYYQRQQLQKNIFQRNSKRDRSTSRSISHSKSFTHSKTLNKSISVHEQFLASKKMIKQPQMKSTLNFSKGFNDTTKQNTTNFNRTRNSAQMENMQNRINKLFRADSFRKKTPSKSPNHNRSTNYIKPKPTQNKFQDSIRGSILKRR